MDRRKFRIVSNELIASDTYKLKLSCGQYLQTGSGQFVDIEIPPFYLRRPLAVCDFTAEGELTLCYKVVGEGTKVLATKQTDEELDILTGLGKGFNPSKCKDSALLVAGGLGSAPLHLLCKELVSMGKKVTVIQCFNTAEDILLTEDFRKLGIEPIIVTLDGSKGLKGFALDAVVSILKGKGLPCPNEFPSEFKLSALFDIFYCCGPLPMMKSICLGLDIDGEASLEARMGCGAGYCYGCSCKTKQGAKRVCADGPVFDKNDIIWE